MSYIYLSLQSIPLKFSFSGELQNEWRIAKKTHGQKYLDKRSSITVTESLYRLRGSCCDSGRNNYAPNKHQVWWHAHPDWGLVNVSTWLKIGVHGITFPPITAHKGTCLYSSDKHLCPLPVNCTTRRPPLGQSKHHVWNGLKIKKLSLVETMQDTTFQDPVLNVCGAVSTVTNIGDFNRR